MDKQMDGWGTLDKQIRETDNKWENGYLDG